MEESSDLQIFSKDTHKIREANRSRGGADGGLLPIACIMQPPPKTQAYTDLLEDGGSGDLVGKVLSTLMSE